MEITLQQAAKQIDTFICLQWHVIWCNVIILDIMFFKRSNAWNNYWISIKILRFGIMKRTLNQQNSLKKLRYILQKVWIISEIVLKTWRNFGVIYGGSCSAHQWCSSCKIRLRYGRSAKKIPKQAVLNSRSDRQKEKKDCQRRVSPQYRSCSRASSPVSRRSRNRSSAACSTRGFSRGVRTRIPMFALTQSV